jgi:hypothetical protein
MFIFLNSVILHIDLAEKLHAVEDSLQTLVRNIINNVFSHWFSLGLPGLILVLIVNKTSLTPWLVPFKTRLL